MRQLDVTVIVSLLFCFRWV